MAVVDISKTCSSKICSDDPYDRNNINNNKQTANEVWLLTSCKIILYFISVPLTHKYCDAHWLFRQRSNLLELDSQCTGHNCLCNQSGNIHVILC